MKKSNELFALLAIVAALVVLFWSDFKGVFGGGTVANVQNGLLHDSNPDPVDLHVASGAQSVRYSADDLAREAAGDFYN